MLVGDGLQQGLLRPPPWARPAAASWDVPGAGKGRKPLETTSLGTGELSRLWILLPRTFGVAEYLIHDLAECHTRHFLDYFLLPREVVMSGRAAPLVDVTAQKLSHPWVLLLRATHMHPYQRCPKKVGLVSDSTTSMGHIESTFARKLPYCGTANRSGIRFAATLTH